MQTSDYIGQPVSIIIDRPVGSKHPDHGHVYPVNYGYIPNALAAYGEEQDAYVQGVFDPVDRFDGVCIAVIRRADEVEDKLVVAPEGRRFTKDQIAVLTEFQERHFTTTICT